MAIYMFEMVLNCSLFFTAKLIKEGAQPIVLIRWSPFLSEADDKWYLELCYKS